ncbi:Protein of unknown function (DUF4238) domain containing protein [Hyaloscypha variabilis]
MAQYQHYRPQFLLRNFSHPYKPPKKNDPKRAKARDKKVKYRVEKVLNVVDLSSDEPQLLEAPVARWFGQENMYKEVADAIKTKKDVEQELSKLECRTAEILQKVKKAHGNGEAGLWLTRSERNLLRKFLFIMKYRGPGYYEKYFCEDPQTYDSEDKHLLMDYMADKGFARPKDVWLHNLRAILDLDMDAEGEWMSKLPEVMFPADAAMFIFHGQSSYMAFCTPTEEPDEFILTDQCYNVFEGPINETFSANTGEYLGGTYLCYHEFGPVSPRLIIVLRSSALPEALEDSNSKIQKLSQRMQNAAAAQFSNPQSIKSILADLPVAKPMNNYTSVINGSVELAPGESGTPSSRDKFCFRFWPISTKHVDTINSVFLDNLLHCKSVVFGSNVPFRRTLEVYMTSRADGFKKVGVGERGARASRFACIEKLTMVLKLLGSENVPVWFDKEGEGRQPFRQSLDDMWLEMMKGIFEFDEELPESTETQFWQVYSVLGGSRETFLKDLEQSWRLYKFEAQIWIWTMKLDNNLRRKVDAELRDLVLQDHPRRVWLYVKHRRWMFSNEYAMHQETFVGTSPVLAAKTKALLKAELEDEVVKANPTINQRRLSDLIYAAGAFS